MMTTPSLRVTDPVAAADEIAEFVTGLAYQGGLDRGRVYRLRLAVDEVTTNIAAHGYHGAGEIEILGEVGQDRVWIRIDDQAPAFDPRERVAAESPDPHPEGGMGLYLAITGLDEFRYDHVGGRNQNTMIMFRSADPGADAARVGL